MSVEEWHGQSSDRNPGQALETGAPMHAKVQNVPPIVIGIAVNHGAGALEYRLPFSAGVSLAEPAEREQVDSFFIIQLKEQEFQPFARR